MNLINLKKFHIVRIMLNIIRYGGYNVGALSYEEGGYLHEVPSISQFISGMIPIIVPTDSNQIIVSSFDTLQFEKMNITEAFYCCFEQMSKFPSA